jgi:hypothetical protein
VDKWNRTVGRRRNIAGTLRPLLLQTTLFQVVLSLRDHLNLKLKSSLKPIRLSTKPVTNLIWKRPVRSAAAV